MERTSENTYPFVKCLHPQVIINKYTHEKMMVSCGKCEACLSRKSAMSTMKCRLESQQHVYCKFVTLTYDEKSVPRMIGIHKRFMSCSDKIHDFEKLSSPYALVEREPRLDGNERQILSPFQSLDTLQVLQHKTGHTYLPYLCKRDLQLFLKRLRKNIDAYAKKFNIPFGKIRYYACGEYGPVHFRPHYHLILWYSCDEVHSHIGEIVSKSWSFGRVSTETPRDDVSKYVAKYVNGNSNLPEIFKSPQIRPFSIHSQHLGEAVFQERREEIYSAPTEQVVRKSLFVNGSYSDVYMWRSLKTYYFPRCKAYDLCNTQQRLYAYTIKARANEIVGKGNVAQQTRFILAYFQYMTKYNILLQGQWHVDPLVNDFYRYFIDYCDVNPYHLTNNECYERSFRSVYMVLRLSNHFINLCCDGSLGRAEYMVNKIDNFYKDCDYLNLCNQYIDLEEFAKDWFEDEEEYKLCFQHYPDSIMNTRLYKRFRARTINNFNESMKHKKLNDMNRIFENLK